MIRFAWRRALACLVLVIAAVSVLAQSLTIGDLAKNIGDYVNKDVTVKGVIAERGENPDVLGDLKNRFVLKDPTTNATLEVLTSSSIEAIPKIDEPFEVKGTVKMREGNIIFMESRGGLNLLLIALVVLGVVAVVLIYMLVKKPASDNVIAADPGPGKGPVSEPVPVMATCPHCGAQTPAGKNFCQVCQRPMTAVSKVGPGRVDEGPTRAEEGPTRADHVIATLTLKQGNVTGKTRDSKIELSGKSLTLGRTPGTNKENKVVMPEDNVSKEHAKIEVVGTEVNLVDLGSTNGTFVNGSRVTKQALAEGDEIRIGDNVFVFNKTSPTG